MHSISLHRITTWIEALSRRIKSDCFSPNISENLLSPALNGVGFSTPQTNTLLLLGTSIQAVTSTSSSSGLKERKTKWPVLSSTGNAVVKDGERRDEIRDQCNDALCIEMEAAGVDAGLPALSGHPRHFGLRRFAQGRHLAILHSEECCRVCSGATKQNPAYIVMTATLEEQCGRVLQRTG